MYTSMKISVFAPSIASTSAGKYCSPLRSSVSRLPSTYSGTLEFRAQREVIGKERPGRAAMHLRVHDLEAAHVDAIEAHDRQHAREGAQMPAARRGRHLGH